LEKKKRIGRLVEKNSKTDWKAEGNCGRGGGGSTVSGAEGRGEGRCRKGIMRRKRD